jgi:hypothetical protein
MVHICSACGQLLKDGEKVSVNVSAIYRVLKSSIAYALDKSSLEADSETLKHLDCSNPRPIEGD